METIYQRNVTQSYMIIKNESCAIFESKMLEKNTLHGFLKYHSIQKNGGYEFWYDITALQSIEHYLGMAKMNMEMFVDIFLSLYACMKEAERFLLSQKQIDLSLDNIYIDAKTQQIYVCYLPVLEEKENTLLYFMQDVLKIFDHKDTNAVSLLYQMYEWVRQDCYDLEQMKEECIRFTLAKQEQKNENNINEILVEQKESNFSKLNKSIKGEINEKQNDDSKQKNVPIQSFYGVGEIPDETSEESVFRRFEIMLRDKLKNYIEIPEKATKEINPKMKGNRKNKNSNIKSNKNNRKEHGTKLTESLESFKDSIPKEKKAKKQKREGFIFRNKEEKKGGESELFYEPKEEQKGTNPTVLLSDLSRVIGKLEYHGKEKENDFYLTQSPFYIGTKEDAVHALLHSNGISRVHAKIDKTGDDYYLTDLNSRNGTWVEGEMITCNTPVLLKKQTKIQFGDREFIFL